jgi:drug/metabolite transporter (DMT)-like permease
VSVIYVLLSRSLSKTESTMAMLFYVAVVGTLLSTLWMLLTWQTFVFTWFDIGLLIYMGAASLAGHFLFTSAYRYAPASMLAPFNYFHIALAVIMGWLLFGHVPDGITFIGMAMIAAAGIAVALHAHITRQRIEKLESVGD